MMVKNFANEIAGCLYQADISIDDLRALRKLHGQTQVAWLRKVVARFARKTFSAMSNADSKTKATLSADGGTLTVEFADDAFVDAVTMKRLNEWFGPITDFHLGRLHRLKSLEALSLDSTDVTSDGIAKLAAALPNLKRIRLPQSVLNPSLVEELQRRGMDVAH